ncbi:MAG: ABC transporter ATP-binding protein [Pseudomonadota bacterium]
MNVLLNVRGLTKRFGGVRAVDGLSLDLAAGEVVALIGPNGAGKSTAFDLICGQRRRDAGTVTLDGRPLSGRSPREAWAAGIARSFQVAGLFASMTAAENVQMALIAANRGCFRLLPRARHQHRAEAEALLDAAGLAGVGDRPAAVLAHGDAKRLELAMALAGSPRLLMMDEPTAGMAPDARAGLMRTVRERVQATKLSVLFTEHDMDIVFATADRVLVLDRGRLIAEGAPGAVRADPRVRAVYLGEEVG